MRIPLAQEFGKAFVPKFVRPLLRKHLLKAGITKAPYTFFGVTFYISYLITAILFFYFYNKLGFFGSLSKYLSIFVIWFLIPLALMAITMIFVYFYIDIQIYNRTKKMEEILPDFLQAVSSNLRAGLAFEKALWGAINPRFGILANEIAIAAKKVMTGHDVDMALTEFANKYDSPVLKRSINLIIGEISSGGKIAEIMDNIVDNLKKTKNLREEMNAATLTYMIFISAVVIFISPILFALSYNLLLVIQHVTSLIAGNASSSAAGVGGAFFSSMSKVSVDKNSFIWFSHSALAVVALFSSAILSIIQKGNIRGGVKYIPLFIISSQLFYVICLSLFGAIFGSFLPISP